MIRKLRRYRRPKKLYKPAKSCPVTTTQITTTTTSASLNTSVLILSKSHRQIITDAMGNVEYAEDDFEFSLGENTEVYYSCSLTWRGRFFVFGGDKQKKQISIINGCRLERVDSLDFDQTYGGCANVNDRPSYCFNYASADYKKCRVANDPFGTFEEIEETVYNHKQTLIGASRGKIY